MVLHTNSFHHCSCSFWQEIICLPLTSAVISSSAEPWLVIAEFLAPIDLCNVKESQQSWGQDCWNTAVEHTLPQNKAIFDFNHAHKHMEESSDVSSDNFYPLQVLKEWGEKVFMGFMVFPFFVGRKTGILKCSHWFLVRIVKKGCKIEGWRGGWRSSRYIFLCHASQWDAAGFFQTTDTAEHFAFRIWIALLPQPEVKPLLLGEHGPFLGCFKPSVRTVKSTHTLYKMFFGLYLSTSVFVVSWVVSFMHWILQKNNTSVWSVDKIFISNCPSDTQSKFKTVRLSTFIFYDTRI